MKIGDLVEFSYGKLGGQIERMGLYAGEANYGMHRVLYAGKSYEVREQCIKLVSVARKADVNEVQDN
jgi:hypothetical protein|tara:strand:+ start:2184 stop:2384 length:201 start_codon:yes stop_codon:yes gene_type:complete